VVRGKLGRSHRLLLTDEAQANGSAPLRLTGGRFILARKEQPRAEELFTRWDTEDGLTWLRRRVDQLAPRIGQRPPRTFARATEATT
jgi:hypothetical protein